MKNKVAESGVPTAERTDKTEGIHIERRAAARIGAACGKDPRTWRER